MHPNELRTGGGFFLLFASGTRPSADDIDRIVSASNEAADQTVRHSQIINCHGADDGWIELLASGLSFDLHGLMPAGGCFLPHARHFFGLPSDAPAFALEAIALYPGPHMAEAAAMLPVLRIMANLASALAQGLRAHAVCWQPSGCWMDPNYFQRMVSSWLDGGPFPALGLTGINRMADGSVKTDGLAFFVGQEMQLESRPGESDAASVKLALRLIDHVVRQGAVIGCVQLTGPNGELLTAEVAQDGRNFTVRR